MHIEKNRYLLLERYKKDAGTYMCVRASEGKGSKSGRVSSQVREGELTSQGG